MTQENQQASDYQYDGNVDKFYAELNALNETSDETPETPIEEEAQQTEGEPEKQPETQDETPEEDDDAEEDEGDGIPKGLVEKIFADENLQKALKNRYIRDLKDERKHLHETNVKQASELAVLNQRISGYEKAMEEFFSKQQTTDDFEPVDKEAWDRQQKELDAIKKESKEDKEKRELKEVNERFFSDAARQGQEFSQKNADYPDAVKFIQDLKVAEFKAMGMDDGKAQQQFNDWANGMSALAWKDGRNIAETAYNLAKGMGYRKKAEAKPEGKPAKTPDLSAIEVNMKKSSSEPPSSTAGIAKGNEGIKVDEHGRPDPKAFWASLKQIHGA